MHEQTLERHEYTPQMTYHALIHIVHAWIHHTHEIRTYKQLFATGATENEQNSLKGQFRIHTISPFVLAWKRRALPRSVKLSEDSSKSRSSSLTARARNSSREISWFGGLKLLRNSLNLSDSFSKLLLPELGCLLVRKFAFLFP